ncbi:MAG: hypothetical protein AAGG99_08860, partial [Pseudomonadota bacterium]
FKNPVDGALAVAVCTIDTPQRGATLHDVTAYAAIMVSGLENTIQSATFRLPGRVSHKYTFRLRHYSDGRFVGSSYARPDTNGWLRLM